MFTYADPDACPSCRARLTKPLNHCAACGFSLVHPLVPQVFASLQRADVLVEHVRSTAVSVTQPPTYVAPAPFPAPFPAPAPIARSGVRTSSVPAILLGLGALCLLVAAVAFLAVAWSWLGVGGRTAVLVGLTLAAGAGGLALGRRGLRVAAEALVTVALGLVALDVLGAESAGWWGDLSYAGLICVLGLALAAASVLVVVVDRRLVVPQVAGVLGLFVASAVLPQLVGHELVVAGVVAVAFGGLAQATSTVHLAVAPWALGAAAVLSWIDLTGSALRLLDVRGDLSVADLWSGGSGPALTAAALLLLGPLAVTRAREMAQPLTTLSVSMLTGVLALPVLDNGTNHVALASLAAGLAWTVVAYAVPRRHLVVPAVPAAASLLPAALIAAGLFSQAVAAALLAGDDLRLDPATPVAEPALLVPAVLAVIAFLVTVVRPAVSRALVVGAAAVVALAAVATLALHPVPLWTVVASLCVLATAYAADALRRPGLGGLVQVVGAVVVLLAAAVVALPSAALLTVPVALLTLLAAATLAVGRFEAADEVGGLLLPLALSALLWTVGDVADVDVARRAVPVLVAVGLLALVRPRLEVELPAALAGFVAACVAIPEAGNVSVSLALHLTVAGALVTIQSLVHPSRRGLAWVGGALLMLATWVRLADLGVDEPEAYTLPAAVVLTLVGLRHLLRDRRAATGATLLPGLTLATVPTLLHVLATDPVSGRALALGTGCLVLVLAGTRLRWSAPLLVGAVVGGVLALAELQPYAAQTPQWVVIGLAGTVLVVVGITWERRVVDLQRASRYVGRLR